MKALNGHEAIRTFFWRQRYGCKAAARASSAYYGGQAPLLLLQKCQGCGSGGDGQAAGLTEEEEGQEQEHFRRALSSLWRRLSMGPWCPHPARSVCGVQVVVVGVL